MPGVKGKSGRKPLEYEMKRVAVIDKAWRIAEKALDDVNVPLSQKLEIAKAIVVKSMPEKLIGEGFNTQIVLVVPKERRHVAEIEALEV